MPSSSDLVTVATYSTPVEAQLAKDHLAVEGIPSFIVDENLVGTIWIWSQMVGGIKLQVPVDQLVAANAILSAKKLTTLDATDTTWHDEADDPEAANTEEITQNLREQMIDRALRGAILGLLCFPLQIYVFYLLVKIFLANDPLSKSSLQRVIIVAVINLPSVFIMLLFMRGILAWLSE